VLRHDVFRHDVLRHDVLRHDVLRRLLGWVESGVLFMRSSVLAAHCGALVISPRPPGACQILDDGLTISCETPRVNTERAFQPRLVVNWREKTGGS
jgi:hypothetical protein